MKGCKSPQPLFEKEGSIVEAPPSTKYPMRGMKANEEVITGVGGI
jgi:hypothetical protein